MSDDRLACLGRLFGTVTGVSLPTFRKVEFLRMHWREWLNFRFQREETAWSLWLGPILVRLYLRANPGEPVGEKPRVESDKD